MGKMIHSQGRATTVAGTRALLDVSMSGVQILRIDATPVSVAAASAVSDSFTFTKFVSDGPIGLSFVPNGAVAFMRVNGTLVRVTQKDFILDPDRPFALVDGTAHLSARTRITGEIVSFPTTTVLERASAVYSRKVGISSLRTAPTRADTELYWQRTLSYCRDVLLGERTASVANEEVVVALLLDAAVRTFVREPDALEEFTCRPAGEAAVRFIETNAQRKITLKDISLAAGVSERVLGYYFQEDMRSTPMEHLRHTRLHAARRDLRTMPSSEASLADIAARWQFSNTTRFAGYYSTLFGEDPRQTTRA